MTALGPLGDRAFLARFETEDDAAQWALAVRTQAWPGVTDVVLAYRSAAVFVDPARADLDRLEAELRQIEPGDLPRTASRLVHLPVLYDGEDLDDVARQLGLTTDEVATMHSGHEYHVYAIGFLPGFPYAGYLPEALSGLPRRPVPRVRVAGGSVAIAGRQTGVYPGPSPGGWHLIGRTPLRIVDLQQNRFPIRAGDRIRFDRIDLAEFDARRGESL